MKNEIKHRKSNAGTKNKTPTQRQLVKQYEKTGIAVDYILSKEEVKKNKGHIRDLKTYYK